MSCMAMVAKFLRTLPDVRVGIVFGSVATARARFDSDLDVAVAADKILTTDQKKAWIEVLALRSGRPVDLLSPRSFPPGSRWYSKHTRFPARGHDTREIAVGIVGEIREGLTGHPSYYQVTFEADTAPSGIRDELQKRCWVVTILRTALHRPAR